MAPETTKVVPLTCHGHSRPVTHISFSAVTNDDQYYLISACKDNNPMLRDGITGDWIGTFLGHKGAVWQARLSGDATLAVTGSADFSAKVWDTHTGDVLHTLQHAHIVRAVAFPSSPSPTILATGGAEKRLRIFDLTRSSTGSTSPPPKSTEITNGTTPVPSHYEIGQGVHTGTIKSIVWTPNDPNVLITAADDKKLRWWDLRTKSPIAEFAVEGIIGSCEINTSSPSITSATTASSNGSLLSVAAGKSVYFFSATGPPTSGPVITHTLPVPQVDCVAVNVADGKFVTGGGGDTWVHVWDYATGEEVEVGKGHHGPVWSVAYSPDGRLYATGSEDGTVKLWKNKGGAFGLWQ